MGLKVKSNGGFGEKQHAYIICDATKLFAKTGLLPMHKVWTETVEC